MRQLLFVLFILSLPCWGKNSQKKLSDPSNYPIDYPSYYREYNLKNHSLGSQIPVKISSGEEIEMAVEFLGLSALNLIIKVGANQKKIDGREAYSVQWKMKSQGFYSYFYKVENSSSNFFDVATSLPLRHSLRRVQSKKTIYEVQVFDHKKLQRSIWQQKNDGGKVTQYKKETYLPVYYQNLIGFMQFIRSLPAKFGKNYTLPVVMGKRVWMMQLDVVRGKKLSFKERDYRSMKVTVNGVRVDQVLKKKRSRFHLLVWISLDDVRRVLRFEAKTSLGRLKGVLVRHRVGAS